MLELPVVPCWLLQNNPSTRLSGTHSTSQSTMLTRRLGNIRPVSLGNAEKGSPPNSLGKVSPLLLN